ncbi:ferritin-like domain-containing protein [Pseudanabaena yagii]|uniref:Ferritin-like domain-containing protein n=1 Tax=Pseudanabaena yagii GIHE-NHR1 TaxID=2722753 RepID=A0ABX1LY48_9CYAN|nr:ferritin-like domain-containing protein [Pseudanabaena yagii]NMF60396.1 ferritin-like domain-containing protein [Pseudanabaena yagii GIHE-NHR1]
MSRTERSSRSASRRELIKAGLFGAMGIAASTAVVPAVMAQPKGDVVNDIKVLNKALFYEHQAIWAYGFAAGKLTDSNVGKAVLAIALANQSDHKAHRDLLASVVKQLGGTPVTAKMEYLKTVTPYIERGEGNLDSDVNIAKLALALEVDAAIAYGREVATLKNPELITAGASIGSTEASHATVIRAAFQSLGVSLNVVPAAFVSKDTRNDWILKV